MLSRLITKISGRPNYYYFAKALCEDKAITVKVCLFTDDEDEANQIALMIKNIVDSYLLEKLNYQPKTSKEKIKYFKMLADPKKIDAFVKRNRLAMSVEEYRAIIRTVVEKYFEARGKKPNSFRFILSKNKNS